MSSQQQKEIERRRTFGIISHPDAGKTTLTEKLLLFGGAIQMAGAVKSRKTAMHATSDWMAIERERGISVTTSVMKFNYRDYEINLLDTPGHQDFSEDTYRVLTAVDSALMVIDSAKGVETQTTKLMEVCRMRNTPIITFINKLDREGLDPLDLLADIEEKLQIECVPLSWPIGMGKGFKGVYDLHRKQITLFTPSQDTRPEDCVVVNDLANPQLDDLLGGYAADKLREERVRRVIEPLLIGQDTALDLPLDDIDYARDLGLVALDKPLRVANPIYREVIPRQLTASTEEMTVQESAWYVRPDGRLDMEKLLGAFQQFFREHAEHWIERFQYREAGPQLLLQAFLQRIVNGGGRIDREYGLGRKRTDLLVQWPLDEARGFLGPVQRAVLELKLLHKSLEATLREGLAQTADYLDRTGAEEGHLLLFDRTPGVLWEQKHFHRTEPYGSHLIQVWGM